MSIITRIICIVVFSGYVLQLAAQEAEGPVTLRGTTSEILSELSEIFNRSIIYNPEIFDQKTHHIEIKNQTVDELLTQVIKPNQFESIITDESIIIRRKRARSYTGYIQQHGSLISLPYAAIKIKDNDIYTVSDEYGRFHIHTTLPAEVQISYLGHRDTTIILTDDSNQSLSIILNPDNELDEIIIQDTEQSDDLLNRYTYQGDKIKLLTKDIPGIGGNNDLLNATRGIAGISSGNGGISGYFIRGGTNAQNLFLLDGVSIYNPFHSFGLTSIVTADISQSLQVYKSGFRARHADRSSGIIDIKIKEGNSSTYRISGELNTQDGSLNAQGPIIDDHTSFFISGRSTTISGPFNNIIKNAIYGSTEAENGTDYYDIVFKLKSQLNANNSIELTTYKSDDTINGEIEASNEASDNEQQLHWGNEMYSINWAAQINPQVFANTRISSNSYFTDYEFLNEFDDEEQNILFVNNSSMNRDLNIETRIDALIAQKMRIQSGISYLSKQFSPTAAILTEDSEEIDRDDELAIDNLSQEIIDTDPLKSNLFTSFTELSFENNNHRLIAGLRLNSYHSEEFNDLRILPRLSYNYFFNSSNKLEASISRTAQYDHLLSLSDIFLPQDIWYPSGAELVPQDAWHYNLAFIHSSKALKIRHEIFTIKVAGITYSTYDQIDGAFQELNLYTVQGESQVYGYELSGEYSTSSLRLMTSLSISKSTNQFDEINLGNEFPNQFDRLMEFNLLGSYQFSKRLTLGIVSYVASGHPLLVTEPVNEELGLVPFDINPDGQKNAMRTGLNHRLDLSLIYSFHTGAIEHRLKFNYYNSYNISQPLYFTNSDTGLSPNFSLPSIFSVAYSFTF